MPKEDVDKSDLGVTWHGRPATASSLARTGNPPPQMKQRSRAQLRQTPDYLLPSNIPQQSTKTRVGVPPVKHKTPRLPPVSIDKDGNHFVNLGDLKFDEPPRRHKRDPMLPDPGIFESPWAKRRMAEEALKDCESSSSNTSDLSSEEDHRPSRAW